MSWFLGFVWPWPEAAGARRRGADLVTPGTTLRAASARTRARPRGAGPPSLLMAWVLAGIGDGSATMTLLDHRKICKGLASMAGCTGRARSRAWSRGRLRRPPQRNVGCYRRPTEIRMKFDVLPRKRSETAADCRDFRVPGSGAKVRMVGESAQHAPLPCTGVLQLSACARGFFRHHRDSTDAFGQNGDALVSFRRRFWGEK